MHDPSPRALLFDLDGTLVDSLPDIHASAAHVRSHFGLAAPSLEAVRGMVGDGPQVLLARLLADGRDALALDDPRLDEAMAIWSAHHADQCTRLVQCYPGVPEHLRRWRAAGHRLAVVTNKPERFARAILSHLDLTPCLDAVVGGDTTSTKKPDPAPIRHALGLLDVAAADAVMVGDGPQDVDAGRAAGCATIAVRYGFNPDTRLADAAPDGWWTAFAIPDDGASLWPTRKGGAA
jgi:phosphoglycolate phosphatase